MVTIRKTPLVSNEIYHIFNKSIAEFKIFNNREEFLRMKEVISYYQWKDNKRRFSVWKIKKEELKEDSLGKDKYVKIISYCIMPTHIHLILKQLIDKGISIFMSQISNSYARYFNTKHKRKGSLWESEFKNKLVTNDEQLLHLTRYIHLNPVSAFLVEKPEDWEFSSYKEFLREVDDKEKICDFEDIIDFDPFFYKKFVEDRISYQRELEKIKNLILE
jgi:putative transposase